MQLNLTSLKYKEKSTVDGGTTDWRKICKDDKHQKLYNKYLLEYTSHTMAYDDFCEAAVREKQPPQPYANVKDGTKQVKLSSNLLSTKKIYYAIYYKTRICFPQQTFPKYNNN